RVSPRRPTRSPTFLPITLFPLSFLFLFFFTAPAPTEIYTLSLHDALPIFHQVLTDYAKWPELFGVSMRLAHVERQGDRVVTDLRSEEHTSELQSRFDLVCRLLLEKKKKKNHMRQVQQSTTEKKTGCSK